MCDNPAPQFGGLDCTYDGSSDTETEDCNIQECPSKFNKFSYLPIIPRKCSRIRLYESTFIELVDGGWGEFTDWEECPVSCGGGQHSRFYIILL